MPPRRQGPPKKKLLRMFHVKHSFAHGKNEGALAGTSAPRFSKFYAISFVTAFA